MNSYKIPTRTYHAIVKDLEKCFYRLERYTDEFKMIDGADLDDAYDGIVTALDALRHVRKDYD